MVSINPLEIDKLESFFRDLYRKEIRDANLSIWTADIDKEVSRCSDAFKELSLHPDAFERLKAFSRLISSLIFLRMNKIITQNPRHISNTDKVFMDALESTILSSIFKVEPVIPGTVPSNNDSENAKPHFDNEEHAKLTTPSEGPVTSTDMPATAQPPEPLGKSYDKMMMVRVIMDIDPKKPLVYSFPNPYSLPKANLDYILRTNDILTVPVSSAKLLVDRKVCAPINIDLEGA